jgi:hypothetical protein
VRVFVCHWYLGSNIDGIRPAAKLECMNESSNNVATHNQLDKTVASLTPSRL